MFGGETELDFSSSRRCCGLGVFTKYGCFLVVVASLLGSKPSGDLRFNKNCWDWMPLYILISSDAERCIFTGGFVSLLVRARGCLFGLTCVFIPCKASPSRLICLSFVDVQGFVALLEVWLTLCCEGFLEGFEERFPPARADTNLDACFLKDGRAEGCSSNFSAIATLDCECIIFDLVLEGKLNKFALFLRATDSGSCISARSLMEGFRLIASQARVTI